MAPSLLMYSGRNPHIVFDDLQFFLIEFALATYSRNAAR